MEEKLEGEHCITGDV